MKVLYSIVRLCLTSATKLKTWSPLEPVNPAKQAALCCSYRRDCPRLELSTAVPPVPQSLVTWPTCLDWGYGDPTPSSPAFTTLSRLLREGDSYVSVGSLHVHVFVY